MVADASKRQNRRSKERCSLERFRPVEPGTATGKAAELLADVQNTLGLTPNMTKVVANSPALLRAIWR
jgi:hypothetical protein